MKRICVSFVLFICFMNGAAYAGRPFSTEDAGVAGKGVAQGEFAVEYAKQDADKDYAFIVEPIYGLTEWFELSVLFAYKIKQSDGNDDSEGVEDIHIALKALIIEEREVRPAFAVKTVIKLDSGDEQKGLGSGDEDLSFIAAVSKNMENVTLHANLGYTFVGKEFDSTLKDDILYGIAVEYAIRERLKLAGEFFGESDPHFDIDAFQHHVLQALVGIIYQMADKVKFDAAVKFGISDGSDDYGFTTGLSITF